MGISKFERAACDSALTCARLEIGCQFASELRSDLSMSPGNPRFDLTYRVWQFEGSGYRTRCPNYELLLEDYLQQCKPKLNAPRKIG